MTKTKIIQGLEYEVLEGTTENSTGLFCLCKRDRTRTNGFGEPFVEYMQLDGSWEQFAASGSSRVGTFKLTGWFKSLVDLKLAFGSNELDEIIFPSNGYSTGKSKVQAEEKVQ
jgi:hypothetical protein